MSDLSLFLKKNKKVEDNRFFAATKSLTDKDGNPLMWEIRKVTSKELEAIREACTNSEKTAEGYRRVLNASMFLRKYATAAIVFPDLNNKELQDSYGVLKPEDLLVELVDDPAEYNNLCNFVQSFADSTLAEDIAEAKN